MTMVSQSESVKKGNVAGEMTCAGISGGCFFG